MRRAHGFSLALRAAVVGAIAYAVVPFGFSVEVGSSEAVTTTTASSTTTAPPAVVLDAMPAETTVPVETTAVEVTAPVEALAATVETSRRCPEFEQTFADAGLPPKKFSFIAWRESRCKPTAYNDTLNRDGSRDYGLLQINSTWKKVTSAVCGTPYGELDVLFTVNCNIAVAKYLYDNGGLGHWAVK